MLTVEQVFDAIRHLYGADRSAWMAIKHSMDEFRAIEAAACAELRRLEAANAELLESLISIAEESTDEGARECASAAIKKHGGAA